jgi:hypothetical protein
MSTAFNQYQNIQILSFSFTLNKSKKPIMSLSNAMRAEGLEPPNNILPGKAKRFSTNGKSSDRAGWVYLYPGNQLAQLASFGCKRTKTYHVWHLPRSSALLKCKAICIITTTLDGSNTQQSEFIQFLSLSITASTKEFI